MFSERLSRRVRAGLLALGSLLAAASARAQDASPIRLDDLIRSALDSSPQVAAARARVEAARGGRVTAGTLANPLLTVQIENGGYPGQGTPDGFEPERSIFGTIPLESLLQRGPRVRRADEEIRAAEADLEATRWTVTLEAARTFYRVALARITVESALDIRKGLDELARYNEARVKERVTPEGDLIRVRIERDRAAIEEAAARAELARATAQLRPYLGEASQTSPNPFIALSIDASEPPPALAPFADIVTRARTHQPQLLAARARVLAARADIDLQRTLTLRQIGAVFGNKRAAGQNSMIAGLTLPLPLFDRNRGEIIRAAAERTAVERDAEWTERTVIAHVEGAYEAARLLGDEVRGSESDLAGRAVEARTITLAAYREGTGSLLQVLDATRSLGEVRLASARLLTTYRESLLELEATSGGDPAAFIGKGISTDPQTTGGKK